ncbi:MAG: 50S ribosomal protein L10 [Minisyncoccia bacterium]
MAISREKKEEVVARVKEGVKDAKTIAFVGFRGLTVGEQSELRKGLRTHGVGYRVVKKTLLNRALEGAGFAGTAPELPGEIAFAYGQDELAPAREVAAFAKQFSDRLALMGGVFEGAYVDAAQIRSIAAIPGLEALRAQFVQLINSPIQRFAVVLNAKAEK